MRILTGKKWREGFLDYYRSPTEYRIQVLAWKNLEKLENVYHIRPKSVKLLLNYLPVTGPSGLLIKIWSRLREEYRNEKYVSCGVGKIMESAEGGRFVKGNVVGFIAPLHPALTERIVLHQTLVFQIKESDLPTLLPGIISYFPLDKNSESDKWWKDIRGWSIYSGTEITEEIREKITKDAEAAIKNTDWQKAQRISVKSASEDSEVSETKETVKKTSPKTKTGVLFGYGNYAKINIIPYSKPFVDIKSVHEIDPTQIFFEKSIERWDSAPFPRKDEKYDVYFIASYNHTHVPIALYALNQGAYVVVEKPVVMDYEELNQLEKALKNGRGLFTGFHKRYSSFNKIALEDLGVKYGEPVSYHCIVYELIQPEFFWYNWPVSRSTFFANGCHQIDHFLYLNDFSEPKNLDLVLAEDGTINVWIELKNGAFFTMAFSEKGSSRVGPRDHIELKTSGRNVRITDAIHYFSEDNSRIIRRKRIFKTESYKRMYQEIGRKIANNEPGDSWRSIKVSAEAMLKLEDKLQKIKNEDGKYRRAKENFLNNFSPK